MPSYNHKINTQNNRSKVDHSRKPKPKVTIKPTSIHTVEYCLSDQLTSLAITYKQDLSAIMRDYNKALHNTNLDHLSNHVADYQLSKALSTIPNVNLLTANLDVLCPFQYQIGNWLLSLIKLRIYTIVSILTNKHSCTNCSYSQLPIRQLLAPIITSAIEAISTSTLLLIADTKSLILDFIDQSNSAYSDLLAHIQNTILS